MWTDLFPTKEFLLLQIWRQILLCTRLIYLPIHPSRTFRTRRVQCRGALKLVPTSNSSMYTYIVHLAVQETHLGTQGTGEGGGQFVVQIKRRKVERGNKNGRRRKEEMEIRALSSSSSSSLFLPNYRQRKTGAVSPSPPSLPSSP